MDGILASSQPPNTNDRDAWPAYWKLQGLPWRTEPEIDEKRQSELTMYRTIVPDIKNGFYPFKNVKLSRADIEWLLATHKGGRGPIDKRYLYQFKGEGLDLRGADLRSVDLRGLPLTCLRAGLNRSETIEVTLEQRHMAKIHLEGANLSFAHLEGAYLSRASLEGANLSHANLEDADLYWSHLENAHLKGTCLEDASLRGCFFNVETALYEVKLRGVSVADTHWGDMNLSRIDWTKIRELGDESEARRSNRWDGKKKTKNETIIFYETATRANRQLAAALEAQGMNEVAAKFAYRSQLLQHKVVWEKRKFAQYLFSLFLSMVSGYGYKLWRSLATYMFVVMAFAIAYYLFSPMAKISLTPLESIVFSVTSFHGRGFSPGDNIGLSNPLTVLAALEAFVGLIVEVTFIATLTQRFFKR